MYDGIYPWPGFKARFQASLLKGNNFIPLYISLHLLIHPVYLLLFISLSNHGSNLFILSLKDPLFVLPLLSVSPAFPRRHKTKAKEDDLNV